jgi:hypothetical protein
MQDAGSEHMLTIQKIYFPCNRNDLRVSANVLKSMPTSVPVM